MKLTFEEYLKYFDVGVKDYVIAAVHGISPSTLKNYKRSWGFTPQVKEGETAVFHGFSYYFK